MLSYRPLCLHDSWVELVDQRVRRMPLGWATRSLPPPARKRVSFVSTTKCLHRPFWQLRGPIECHNSRNFGLVSVSQLAPRPTVLVDPPGGQPSKRVSSGVGTTFTDRRARARRPGARDSTTASAAGRGSWRSPTLAGRRARLPHSSCGRAADAADRVGRRCRLSAAPVGAGGCVVRSRPPPRRGSTAAGTPRRGPTAQTGRRSAGCRGRPTGQGCS